jgi:hypothetical protein
VAVVDGSRSFGVEDRQAGLAALAAALSHYREGRVAVLVFDRKVHRLYPGFREVASATPDLVDLAFASRNGSQVDTALAEADAILEAESPPTSPRRILVITDLRTRMALRPAETRLRSGAIVHVGVVDAGQPGLVPDDESAWADVIQRTGGVVWQAAATADPAAAGEMKRVYEEWARPTCLRHVQVLAPGADDGPWVYPESDVLAEGEAIDRLAIDRHRIGSAKLEGRLWGKRVEHRLFPTEGEARLWAALVFGSELLDDLTEPEMMVLARRGRAVSPVTSYLAIEPGVRPSPEGLEHRTAREPDVIAGAAGLGRQPEPSRLDRQKFLEEELGRAWRRCGGGVRESTVVVETTVAEVVDVPSVSVVGTDAPRSQCLEEATWNLDLPSDFNQPWVRWTVRLPPPALASSAGRPTSRAP